ncbi:MAG: double-strand break repair helicase AddA [Hyphomicrobiales bacterium]|nr:double-strand break repair helicase AddA [Hyphomicrobiales bacterium]
MAVDLKQLTDANQTRASDPSASAWVSANAGTGKTTVLVNRVLRLLLHRPEAAEAYTEPERILCLTYTRAAAGEMENRLFDILSRWAVMAEPELAGALKDLRGFPAVPQDIKRARRLFAITLDTAGGLKIHTIHAFCERLLHRFPLEAGVPAKFRVLEDQERSAARDAAIDEVLTKAVADTGAPLGQALRDVIAATGEERFREIIDVTLGKQEQLRAMGRLAGVSQMLGEAERSGIAAALEVGASRSATDIVQEMADVLSDAEIDAALKRISPDKPTERDLLDALAKARSGGTPQMRAQALGDAFLTQGQKPKQRLMTAPVKAALPDLAAGIEEAQARFVSLAREQAALHIASATGALLTLADEIIHDYEKRKAARAALDYDDLIVKTVSLLSASHAAQWVLYKLDYGIDHILVDEAQDTSPVQWQVIDALVQEFFAGETARDISRTLFAVGDEKQSIYSFQGAEPASFATHGRKYAKAAAAAEHEFARIPLTVSFRSTEPVLKAVDDVFARDNARDGVAWEGAAVVHQAVRAGQAGLVELWPVEEPEEGSPSHPMRPHEDTSAAINARDRLVKHIAGTIRHWLDSGEQLQARGRPIRPGDVLILVRWRDALVPKLVRALKAHGIPVAGADRMTLSEQLAVMDLMAVADFVLLPDDDLTLATVLKSPLIGFDDDDLFDLAHKRKATLWSSLRDKAQDNERYAIAVAQLKHWLGRADTAPPYEFFAGLLEERQMRMRLALIARLGADAGDAIDEFLNLALDYERVSHPSLQGFLDWMRKAEAQVKRDMEQGRDEVRIMTAHGAKGLEANIVILPDTCRGASSGGGKPKLLPLSRASAPPDAPAHLVWVPSGTMELEAVAEAKGIVRQAEREEHNRLLYVAMTRARDRLYVCGWQGAKKRPQECWYNLVSAGLEGLARPASGALGDAVLRYECEQAGKVVDTAEEAGGVVAAARLPDWALVSAPREEPLSLAMTPSSIAVSPDEADAQPLEQDVVPPLARADRSRFLRGNLVHALLQYLPETPQATWERKAREYVETRGDELDEAVRGEVVDETLAILNDAELAALFGPDSLAEVPIVARIERDARDAPPFGITGQVDRLAIVGNAVLIVDYKTNRPPPRQPDDVAPGYLRQLAAYRVVIGELFPQQRVRAALLWTDGPRLMEIPHALLDRAEAEIRGHSPTP